jgi:hypothetical protein
MGKARGTHGRDTKVQSGNLTGREHLGDIGLLERIILKYILRK